MVRFSPIIEQQKKFIIAKLMIWVWCGVTIDYIDSSVYIIYGVVIMNEQIVYMFTDAC